MVIEKQQKKLIALTTSTAGLGKINEVGNILAIAYQGKEEKTIRMKKQKHKSVDLFSF